MRKVEAALSCYQKLSPHGHIFFIQAHFKLFRIQFGSQGKRGWTTADDVDAFFYDQNFGKSGPES